jgi:hypothetical protein
MVIAVIAFGPWLSKVTVGVIEEAHWKPGTLTVVTLISFGIDALLLLAACQILLSLSF